MSNAKVQMSNEAQMTNFKGENKIEDSNNRSLKITSPVTLNSFQGLVY